MTPTLHLIVGPNGAGKSTFYEHQLRAMTRAEFVNPDLLAHEALGRWSTTREDMRLGQDLATARRTALFAQRASLVLESTFSHASKLELVDEALRAGYRLVVYHLSVADADFAAERVADREVMGGHPVPEAKIRERYARNGPLIRQAVRRAHHAFVFDNSLDGKPPRLLVTFSAGKVRAAAEDLPAWARELYGPDLAPQ